MKYNPFCSSLSLPRSGLIENQIFYNLRGHHVLNKEILIRNCDFIGGDFSFELNHEKAHLHKCNFRRQFGPTGRGFIVLGIKGSVTNCCFTDCRKPVKLSMK